MQNQILRKRRKTAEIHHSQPISRATIYTLIGTAELNGWDPQAYLRVLLDRIADHPINRIGDLAPWNLRPDTT